MDEFFTGLTAVDDVDDDDDANDNTAWASLAGIVWVQLYGTSMALLDGFNG